MALDSFQGSRDIILQSNDAAVPYSFQFTVNSSATANDGSIPYGTNISSVVVTSHVAESGSDATTEMVDSSSVNSNTVSVGLNYPSTTGTGWYHLTFECTLDNGAVLEFDFNRVYAEER